MVMVFVLDMVLVTSLLEKKNISILENNLRGKKVQSTETEKSASEK